ncbi:type II secretion system protein GspK [Rheinheimera baltica]|uniref:type II secretion system protein GspK n=1 Tax=Rheinheimera baltica TaxID=67576 RepID=UPI00273DAFE4|nr:type II secretion system protein GspK [Rheinheimera baltica]MDP5149818.1 type II secretion system protein GspK [Rheinheimera baltica]
MRKGFVSQRGVALLLVLLLTAVFSVVITLYQYKNKQMLEKAAMAKDYLTARAKLESVKEELTFRVFTSGLLSQQITPQVNEQFKLPKRFNVWGTPFDFDGATVRIVDSSGLVGAIPFDRGTWHLLLNKLLIEQPEIILDSLEDWYDDDEFVRLNGAERSFYRRQGLPTNDLPQTLFELNQVRQMSEHWDKIRPLVSYIGASIINPEYAPEELLPALVGDFRAGQIIQRRKFLLGDSKDVLSLTAESNEVYPSNRLSVQIEVVLDHASFRQSFTLVRANEARRTSYVGDKMPGFTLSENK